MSSNRVAFISGAGQGIGAAIADVFGSRGINVVINDISERSVKSTVAKLSAKYPNVKFLSCVADISNYESAKRAISFTVKSFGDIHILVNNAGIIRDQSLLKMTEKQWDQVIRVNLKGVFNLGSLVAKVMVPKVKEELKLNNGKWHKLGLERTIINMSSVSCLGFPGQSNYSASKAGVVALTRVWAKELARHRIRVNAIAPGFTDTSILDVVPRDFMAAAVSKTVPLRVVGKVEDVSRTALFLLESTNITGQVIFVDGGLSLQSAMM